MRLSSLVPEGHRLLFPGYWGGCGQSQARPSTELFSLCSVPCQAGVDVLCSCLQQQHAAECKPPRHVLQIVGCLARQPLVLSPVLIVTGTQNARLTRYDCPILAQGL